MCIEVYYVNDALTYDELLSLDGLYVPTDVSSPWLTSDSSDSEQEKGSPVGLDVAGLHVRLHCTPKLAVCTVDMGYWSESH